MSEPILQQVPVDVDEARVGISYSGGGPLLLIELGIAKAFVDLKIVPAAIAGVSAGALAGTAHALDPVNGTGINAAADALLTLSDHKFGLTKAEIVAKVLGSLLSMQRLPLSLGDNAPIQPMVEGVFNGLLGLPGLTVSDFGSNGRVKLWIGGTDRRQCERYWFADSAEVADALVASSAIPGVFPPRKITIDGSEMLFVDGAVAQNQPLSQLVLEDKCGTLYACAVGYDGETMGEPADALENAMSAISILSHESSRLEQGYVELKFQQAGKGKVYHIHPEGPFSISGFNFTADEITQVMAMACQETKDYIQQQGWMPPGIPAPAAAPVPVGAATGGAPNGGGRT
jgi:predicted acylesterase/phospholipase RssA